jgi:hypothetical protein
LPSQSLLAKAAAVYPYSKIVKIWSYSYRKSRFRDYPLLSLFENTVITSKEFFKFGANPVIRYYLFRLAPEDIRFYRG